MRPLIEICSCSCNCQCAIDKAYIINLPGPGRAHYVYGCIGCHDKPDLVDVANYFVRFGIERQWENAEIFVK